MVFGDSWVDESFEEKEEGNGKGRSWAEGLCRQVGLFLNNIGYRS